MSGLSPEALHHPGDRPIHSRSGVFAHLLLLLGGLFRQGSDFALGVLFGHGDGVAKLGRPLGLDRIESLGPLLTGLCQLPLCRFLCLGHPPVRFFLSLPNIPDQFHSHGRTISYWVSTGRRSPPPCERPSAPPCRNWMQSPEEHA